MESWRLAPPPVFGLQGSLCGFCAGLTAFATRWRTHNNTSNAAFTATNGPNAGGASTGSSAAARPCWESKSYVDLRWTQANPNDGNGRPLPTLVARPAPTTTVMDV
jgi:hypothetical protein